MHEAILSESQAMSDKIRAKEINQAFPNRAEWVKGRGWIEIVTRTGRVSSSACWTRVASVWNSIRVIRSARHSLLWNGGCPRWKNEVS